MFPTVLSCFIAASSLAILSRAAPTSTGTWQPVMPSNFADPAIHIDGDTTYTFATDSGGLHVPIAVAKNGEPIHMLMQTADPSKQADAMPALPAWVHQKGSIWAPDVIQLPSGSYILYFTGQSAVDPGKHCVGVATSPTVTGPYTPQPTPFACDVPAGHIDPANPPSGMIDPSAFIDPNPDPAFKGRMYVVYKVDGNSLGGPGQCGNEYANPAQIKPTPIKLQEVSPADGFTPIGTASTILDRTAADGPYVEAPFLTWNAGQYFLFYSSHCFRGPDYDVKWATSPTVKGIYNRQGTLLSSGMFGLNSPGGASLTLDRSSTRRMVFHGDVNPGSTIPRVLYTTEVQLAGVGASLVTTGGSRVFY